MAVDRKRFQWNIYLLAIIIAVFVFTSGLYFGSYTENLKYQSLYDLQSDIRSEVMGAELQYQIFEGDACSLNDMHALTEDLHTVGSRLTSMESQLGADDKGVISLKEYYSLLEIRHYLFMKDMKKRCKSNYGLVLYFYSNAGDCKDCEEQGYVLSYVRRKYDVFNTYSFDVNINNPAIKAIIKYYNITTTPSVVINEKTYSGFQSKEVLMKLLAPNSMISNKS